ncbi:MAG: TrkH family potassium uptake protein [Acutalibacteraceae bacterium]
MNYSMVVYLLGCVFELVGASLLVPFGVGLIYSEKEAWSYLIVAAISAALGTVLILKKPKNNKIFAKEGFVTVSLSWILMSVIGALPFVISKDIPSFMTAFFETVSGFTTTGASNLTEVESLSHASLFWRSETHWLGGVGVIIFILAVVRMTGGYSIQLMRAESPGPSTDKLRPRLKTTAIILYSIYTVLTVLEAAALLICRIPVFDAVTTALATAGTGGFSVRNAGIGAYGNPAAEWVIAVFMVLFGINFNLYYLIIKKRFKEAIKNEELIFFLSLIFVTTTAICINIKTTFPDMFASAHDLVRTSFFTVSAIISSTGFGTADFNNWPEFSKLLIMLIMFCGACAGSTGGGMKVIRIIILIKAGFKEIAHAIHPRSVNAVRVDGKKVSGEVVKSVLAYFVIEMLIIAGSTIVLSLENFDLTTTVTSVITCMHNIGPGLNMVGPMGNFASFSAVSKVVLVFDMLAGRLEILPILVLLSPATWKKN